MEDIKIIEKQKHSLNFIEQLQNQIQLCREGLSDVGVPVVSKVQSLESLLWAKLKKDQEYLDEVEKITKWLKEKREQKRKEKPQLIDWQFEEGFERYRRIMARRKFEAIMVFIDKKGYMPIGEEE